MSKTRSSERPCPEDQQVAGMKWINGLLRDNYKSFQQLRDGVVWCRLLNRVYPGSIRMKSVKQRSTSVVDWYANYHLLYASLNTLDISVDFSIRDLINGQDREIVRAVYFFSDLYLKKKYRQRQNSSNEPKVKRNISTKRESTMPKLQSQRTVSGFDFIPKFKSFFSFDKEGIEYLKLGEDSPEKNAEHLHEREKKRKTEKLRHKQHHNSELIVQQYLEGKDQQEYQLAQPQHEEHPQQQDLPIHNDKEPEAPQQHGENAEHQNFTPVAVINKLEAEQRYQQNLIQMCINLEKAELLMERLWLQRRERRKMRHDQIIDRSLLIGDYL